MDDNKYIPKHASLDNFKKVDKTDNDFNSSSEDDVSEFEESVIVNKKVVIKLDDFDNIEDIDNTKDVSKDENVPIKQDVDNKDEIEELPINHSALSIEDVNMKQLFDTSNLKVSKKTNKKKKHYPKKILSFILLSIFTTTFIISILKITKWNKDNQETSKIIENIQKEIEIVEVQDSETTELISPIIEEETSDYWYYTKFSLIDVDIAKLKEKNQDTVGWINVNNTNVNYPYVQNSDNKFYLDHSYDKTYNNAGWVFMDYRNNSNLENRNTILYAHSRLDDSMFGSLSETLKSNWYQNKDNHIIRISTENENSLWQIFSIYKIEEESYYITTDFPSTEEYQQFLNTIKGRSIYNFNTTLATTDKILTLSTCYNENVRLVVHAKLIKKNVK